MPFRVWVSEFTLSDGTVVQVPETGVVVFVGPNNSGKSVALAEFREHIATTPAGAANIQRRVVADAVVRGEGSPSELDTWLDEHAHAVPTTRDSHLRYRRPNVEASRSDLHQHWNQGPPYGSLGGFVCFNLDATARLGLASSSQSYDLANEAPSSALQVLYSNPALEKRLSEVSRKAFGTPVVVDRVSGSQIHLRFGQLPADLVATVPPSREYLEAIQQIPFAGTQGDGVRSFLGILLGLTAAQYPIVFVDEPEAFLHPPQARLLGRSLGDLEPGGTQVFVATHSLDVLEGLLDSSADVTIVRITRDGSTNPSTVLNRDDVTSLASDTLLRHSGILAAAFHDGVVACEGDSDCGFYKAVMESALASAGTSSNLLFVHAGGKDRLAKLAEAARKLAVCTAVITDFDILREGKALGKIISALGADPAHFEDDRKAVAASIEQAAKPPKVEAVKQRIEAILKKVTEEELGDLSAQKIRASIQTEGGWDAAKRSGLSGVPQGEAHQRCTRLISQLRDVGVFVVDVGTLERWAPSVPAGAGGPSWATAAIEGGAHLKLDTNYGEFIRHVGRFLGQLRDESEPVAH
ncbi:MAG: AAA family ATPase [Actinobacteria bacterium]|nr:AAA family ATPase [Actinomycetota bacterium]